MSLKRVTPSKKLMNNKKEISGVCTGTPIRVTNRAISEEELTTVRNEILASIRAQEVEEPRTCEGCGTSLYETQEVFCERCE